MRVLWLPAALRAAGLTVHEVSGWHTRGADSFGPVRGITCHHTAGSRTSSDEGEIRTLLNGSNSAPPPIAQLYLSRTGDWHVIASGLCFHNRVGWDGPNKGYGNDALLGIEAQHSGGDEPWTDRQYDSYVRGVAALVRHKASSWDVTVGRVAGHKEHQPGAKTDPSFNMDTFRARVRAEISTWEDEVTPEDIEKIADAVRDKVLFDAVIPDFAQPENGRRKLSLATWAGYSDHRRNAILSAINRDLVDEQALATAVLAGLPVAGIVSGIVAALPPEMAKQVVTELGAAITAASGADE
jgi:hypothetical protein